MKLNKRQKVLLQIEVAAIFVVIVGLLTFKSCNKSNFNSANFDEKEQNINILMQTAKTPRIQSVSLTENDRVILDQHLSKYTAFTMDKKELASYFQGGTGSVRLQIDKNLDWTIYLELNDMRTFDYKAYYTTAEGDVEVNEPFVVNTYKGKTSDGQHVRATVDENTFVGVIFGENYHYVIRSTNEYTQNRADNSFIVYKSWDIIPDDNFSDNINDALEVPKNDNGELIENSVVNIINNNGTVTRASNAYTESLVIATEADFTFHQKVGGTTGSAVAPTNSFIMSVLNIVEGAYGSTFLIRFFVSDQFVDNYNNLPYNSNDAYTLLNSFGYYWNSNSNRTSVRRNIAHLFTGRTLNSNYIGYGFVGAINGNTSNNYAYALSTYYIGKTNIAYVATHEIGHNLNADHEPNRAPLPANCNCNNNSTASIMCPVITSAPSLWFCPQSYNEINNYLTANSSLLTYINGPTVVSKGSTNTWDLPSIPGATYSWLSVYMTPSGSTTGNKVTFTATNNQSSDIVECFVTYNGISNYFHKYITVY